MGWVDYDPCLQGTYCLVTEFNVHRFSILEIHIYTPISIPVLINSQNVRWALSGTGPHKGIFLGRVSISGSLLKAAYLINEILGCVKLLNIKLLFFFALLNSFFFSFFFLVAWISDWLYHGRIFTKIEPLAITLSLSCTLAAMENTWKCWFKIGLQ